MVQALWMSCLCR